MLNEHVVAYGREEKKKKMLLFHQDYKSVPIVRESSIVHSNSKRSTHEKINKKTLTVKNRNFLKSIGLEVNEGKTKIRK